MSNFWDRIKPYFTVQLLAYVILAGMTAYAIASSSHKVQQQTANRLDNQQQLQHRQLVEACVRLNVLRASDNGSHYADYVYLHQQVMFTKQSLHANFIALQKAGIDPNVLHNALKQSEAEVATAQKTLKLKTWIPLTDCTAAVASAGVAYRTPSAVHFYMRMPPKSAYNITNARRFRPAGSVK